MEEWVYIEKVGEDGEQRASSKEKVCLYSEVQELEVLLALIKVWTHNIV